MVICPRCAQQVDETTGTLCPNCSTPLPAVRPQPGAAGQPQAPPSYAPQLSRSGGTRVSLTGEVIEDRPAAPPPSYVGGGGAGGRPPIGVSPRAVGLAKPRAALGSTLTEAPAKSGSSAGPIVAILLILLVLGGLGAGGWWFLTRNTPKTVVQQYQKAIAAQDWKTVYTLVELPPDDKAKYTDASSFASFMSDTIDHYKSGSPMMGSAIDAAFKSYQTAEVGEANVTDDTATVPITVKLSFPVNGTPMERKLTMQIPVRKIDGTWKIDASKVSLTNPLGSGAM